MGERLGWPAYASRLRVYSAFDSSPPWLAGASKPPERRSGERVADHSTADSRRPQADRQEVEVARAAGVAAAPGRVRARVHDHAEEAELGPEEGRPCAPDHRGRGDGLHSRHRPQPPG